MTTISYLTTLALFDHYCRARQVRDLVLWFIRAGGLSISLFDHFHYLTNI